MTFSPEQRLSDIWLRGGGPRLLWWAALRSSIKKARPQSGSFTTPRDSCQRREKQTEQMPYVTGKETATCSSAIGCSYLQGAGRRSLPAARWRPQLSGLRWWAGPGWASAPGGGTNRSTTVSSSRHEESQSLIFVYLLALSHIFFLH